MKVEKINKSNVSYYVEVVNELIKNIEESSKSLFELFYEAYKSLTTNEFENEFVPNLKMDKSSINKMKKICKSDFIMRNRDKLPNSWANLYVLVTIDESEIQKLIDNGELTTETTKKKILELRDKINSPIDEDEYDNLVGESANDEGYDDDEEEVNERNKEWIAREMPECNNSGDDDSYKKLVIRFDNEDDFLNFAKLNNNLKLTNKTKSIWYSK